MAITGYQAQGGIFAGNLLLDTLDANGAQTGELDVGETSNFTVEAMKITTKDRTGHRLENYGDLIDSTLTAKPQSLKFTLGDINKKNLAMAMFGTDSVVNQSAVTVTDEVIAARLDKEVKLSKMKLKDGADVPVVKDSATGLITYVEGTHYQVDYTYGTIKALSTGTITEGEALKVTFKCNAYTGFKVQASTLTQIDCLLRLKGKNVVNGKPCVVTVYKCSLKPSGALDFITEDYAKLEFTGDIKAVTAGTWEVVSLDAA